MVSSCVHINCCFITSEIGSRRRNCENFMLQMSLMLDLCLLQTQHMRGVHGILRWAQLFKTNNVIS